MIYGKEMLKEKYSTLDEEQYQPAGIDLTLKNVSELIHNDGTVYGLLQKAKVLPIQKELELKSVMASGMLVDVYELKPHTSYIATTNEKIKISDNAGQFYLPRSSLLRAGITVETAFGDPGFHGHLSFLIINTTDNFFVLEKNVRFAQLIDLHVAGISDVYDGDYNE